MDVKDQKLIALLRKNGRASMTDLAKALGVSRTTVQARIERLERHKIIAGYSVVLGAGFQKEMIESHILINCSPKAAPALERRLGEMDSIVALYAISGEYDMICIATAPSVGDMNDVIDHIGQLEGVERTVTSVVLSKRFHRS